MLISFFRTIILYVIIILALKLMGKRQISELQASELVITLLISNIAAIPMQNSALPILTGLIPIAVLVAFEVFISTVMLRNNKFRSFVCGKPSVIINDGKVDQNQMKMLRISIEDLFSQLRQSNVSSLSDIAYGIIETNGKLSVIKKPDKQQPDAKSLNIKMPDNGVEAVVVRDGKIFENSLKICKLLKQDVLSELEKKEISLENVFIMTSNKQHDFNIIRKEG